MIDYLVTFQIWPKIFSTFQFSRNYSIFSILRSVPSFVFAEGVASACYYAWIFLRETVNHFWLVFLSDSMDFYKITLIRSVWLLPFRIDQIFSPHFSFCQVFHVFGCRRRLNFGHFGTRVRWNTNKMRYFIWIFYVKSSIPGSFRSSLSTKSPLRMIWIPIFPN